jgi:hypothetical protein
MQNYIIGTAYHHATEWDETLFKAWEENTLQYCDKFYCVSTIKRNGSPNEILVNHNLGHIHDLLDRKQNGLSGWSAHIITLSMIAYCGGKDFVFKESDCFWHGDVVGRLYQDLGNARVVFGRKMESEPFMSCSQSTFLIKHNFIPEFISTYLALPDDIDMIAEDKFVELERLNPIQYARTACCIDRERPIPYNDEVWSVQQVKAHELEEMRTRGIIKHRPTIRLILGRYGDVFQVASKMPKTDILACNRKFSQIAKELFPDIELIELDEDDLAKAYQILKHQYGQHRIVACQQNGQTEEATLPFRSYQSFQEYYASV